MNERSCPTLKDVLRAPLKSGVVCRADRLCVSEQDPDPQRDLNMRLPGRMRV